MSEFEVRSVGLEDAAVLAPLVAEFRDHLDATAPLDSEIAMHLAGSLEDPGSEFACAWLDGEAVGYTQTRFFSSVWAPGLEAHVEDLFVVARARRRSVGRALLRHALDRARSRGAVRLTLNTNERNRPAHALYRSEGLAPQSHALYPEGREVLWTRSLRGEGSQAPGRAATKGGSVRYEVAAARVMGIGLPVLETLRRRTNFEDLAGYVDDFIAGAILLLAAWACSKGKPSGPVLLVMAWAILCGGLYGSFFYQLGSTASHDVGGLPNTTVVAIKAVLYAIALSALFCSVRTAVGSQRPT